MNPLPNLNGVELLAVEYDPAERPGFYTVSSAHSPAEVTAAAEAAGYRVETYSPAELVIFTDDAVINLAWMWSPTDRARATVIAELIATGELPAVEGFEIGHSRHNALSLLMHGLPEVINEALVTTATTLLLDRIENAFGAAPIGTYVYEIALHDAPPVLELAARLTRN